MTFNYNEYRLQEINRTIALYDSKALTDIERDFIQHLERERAQILSELLLSELQEEL